ncbi:amino acid adenylation domain-containing protein [Streptosporangium sp. NPDC048865]|uniref:non-ribosomal peptide synthetase n=1 Tax=Streptosporangium sp. NPDC048865 TaxID=3155766 RepID=UPI003429C0D4
MDAEPDRRARVEERRELEYRRPFDVRTPPLVRLHLQRLTDETVWLFVTQHHAVLDGWSERSMFAELLNRYAGRHHHGPPASRFGTYVRLEQESLADDADREFWKAQLEGATYAALPSAADLSPSAGAGEAAPAAATAPGTRYSVEADVDAGVHDGLNALAARLGVPLRTVLLTAHLRVMSVLTGSAEVTTGAVYNGRVEEPDGDRVLGLFLNTLPVHTTLPGGTWSDLVRHVSELDTRIQRHRRFPMTEIARLTGMPAAVDSYFNYTHFHVDRERDTTGRGLDVLEHHASVETEAAFQVEFAVDPAAGRLTLEICYDPVRFTPERMEHAVHHYRAVLAALATDPGTDHRRTPLLGRAERDAFDRVNDTARPLPRTTLPELFRAQAARTPEALAVVSEDERLTYAELDARVETLARVLAGRGAGAESVVAVALPRSVELVVALLAVHRAGAAYLPLDLDYPRERIAFMLADAAPACLVTSSAARPPAADVPVVLVDALGEEPAGDTPSGHDPAAAAYVIYTSGSTGRPKGVVVPQAGIVNRLLWMQDAYRLTAEDRVLQKTPSSFDVSVWEFFWPLITGAALVVARPEGHRDPAYLAALIRRERVTTLHFVPSMLAVFLEEPSVAGCDSLRRVLCSGEALPERTARSARERLGVPVHNLYGPTEASVDVTAGEVRDTGKISIGLPVWNTRVHVLDAALAPVPAGVPGELYLSGVQLARGYLNRPGLTAGRFVADPSGPAGTRMYRTGDIVRRLADGSLEYVGRADRQVKIRGLRLEPGEIEAVLDRHPRVARSAVVVHEDRRGVRRLVGYAVPAAGEDAPLDTAALRASVAAELPAHMVPFQVVELPALPLTPSGKLDRRALPAPVLGAPPQNPWVHGLTAVPAAGAQPSTGRSLRQTAQGLTA